MKIDQYKKKVIEHLKSNKSLSDEAWEELVVAMLVHSEAGCTPRFDEEVFTRKEFEEMYPPLESEGK